MFVVSVVNLAARNIVRSVAVQEIVVDCLVVRSSSTAKVQAVHAYAQVAESLVNGRYGVHKHQVVQNRMACFEVGKLNALMTDGCKVAYMFVKMDDQFWSVVHWEAVKTGYRESALTSAVLRVVVWVFFIFIEGTYLLAH